MGLVPGLVVTAVKRYERESERDVREVRWAEMRKRTSSH
jgi:hypothetical protein